MAGALFLGAQTIGQVNIRSVPIHRIEHLLYYGAMAALVAHIAGRNRLWIPLLVVPLVGAMDEWNQFHIHGRNGSFKDWMVDVIGVLVAVGVYKLATKKRP
jgi:VanZ family protein